MSGRAPNETKRVLSACGLDLERLARTVEEVASGESAARLRLNARTTWLDGHRSEARITTYELAGRTVGDETRWFARAFDEPHELGGTDTAPSPTETLLAALASCVVAATHANAALAGVTLSSLAVNAVGELDLRGMFGLAADVRPGLARITLAIRLAGSASADALRAIAECGVASSPVRDTLARGVAIEARIDAE